MTRPITLATRASTARAKRIRKLLKSKPRTANDLALSIGVTRVSINRYLRALRDHVHIAEWTHDGGPDHAQTYPRAVWSWGAGEDVPKPVRKTNAEYIRAFYARVKAHPDRYPMMEKRRLVRALRERPRSSPLQALVSATLHANRHSQE